MTLAACGYERPCQTLIKYDDSFTGTEGQELWVHICLNSSCVYGEAALPLRGANPSVVEIGRSTLVLRRVTALSNVPQDYELELEMDRTRRDDNLEDGDVLTVEILDLATEEALIRTEQALTYHHYDCRTTAFVQR